MASKEVRPKIGAGVALPLMASVLVTTIKKADVGPCPQCGQDKYFEQPDGRRKCRHCAHIYGNTIKKEKPVRAKK